MFGPPRKHLKMNIVPEGGAQSAPARPRGALGGPPQRKGGDWGRKAILAMRAISELDPQFRGATARQHEDYRVQDLLASQEADKARRDAAMAKFGKELTPQQQALFGIAPDAVIGAKAEQMFATPDPADQLARDKFGHEQRMDKEDLFRSAEQQTLDNDFRERELKWDMEKPRGPLVTVTDGTTPSKPPPGWEGYYDENGEYNLRPTPGGPADTEVRAGEGAKSTMDSVITTFASEYQKLNESGAVRNSEKGPLANMSAYFQTTPAGREFGKMTGSPAEAARETIEALQPNIVQAIMSQPGISARAFDSDKELEFFLRSITAPRADYMANMTALYILDKKFGTGTAVEKILTPDEMAAVQQMSAADPLNFQLTQVFEQPQAAEQPAASPDFDESLLEFMTPEERALFQGGMQ